MASKGGISPVSVPFSGIWDGQNGTFPTFNISIGTPPQTIRLNASWNTAQIMVPLAHGTQDECPINASSVHCLQILDLNTSSTWTKGDCPSYPVANFTRSLLCGNDTIEIDSPGAGPAVIHSQPIIGFPSVKDQTLGIPVLGLNPFSYDDQNNSNLNFLSALKNSHLVPSLSFGMSFGSQNGQNTTPSLVLGGFNDSMFEPIADNSFDIQGGKSNTLTVTISSISFSTSANRTFDTKIEQPPVEASLDNNILDMQFSADICSFFMDKFGLIFESDSGRYLVNETEHEHLTSENPDITFSLGTGWTVNITIPYNSLVLQTRPPHLNRTQRYFPLKQVNGTEFTLGMAFLQQIYLAVNYETKSFFVNQILDNSSKSAVSPSSTTTGDSNPSTGHTLGPTRNTSNIVAETVTIAALCLFLSLVGLRLYFWQKRRNKGNQARKKEVKALKDDGRHRKPEMDGTGKTHEEIDGLSTTQRAELDDEIRVELQGDAAFRSSLFRRNSAELEGDTGCTELTGASTVLDNAHVEEVVQLKTI